MTIKINYKQLPRDLARNIILEDNPYKDDTSFVGQMLKHSSWNDMEYFKLEDGFLKYIDENKSGYKPEVLPIMDNILQIYDKYFDCSYVDFYTCFDNDISIFDRFECLSWLINNLKPLNDYYFHQNMTLRKTIEYNIDNTMHKSTIIGISGFKLNRSRFKHLSCVGLIHALVNMKILHIDHYDKLTDIFSPYKIYHASMDLGCLPYDYNEYDHTDKDTCTFYNNNNTTITESMLNNDTWHISSYFYKANNKMSVMIAKKFHKDFYDIFDPKTDLVSKAKLIDLVNKHNVFALWFNDKSVEECELEILYGKHVKIGDCNG